MVVSFFLVRWDEMGEREHEQRKLSNLRATWATAAADVRFVCSLIRHALEQKRGREGRQMKSTSAVCVCLAWFAVGCCRRLAEWLVSWLCVCVVEWKRQIVRLLMLWLLWCDDHQVLAMSEQRKVTGNCRIRLMGWIVSLCLCCYCQSLDSRWINTSYTLGFGFAEQESQFGVLVSRWGEVIQSECMCVCVSVRE